MKRKFFDLEKHHKTRTKQKPTIAISSNKNHLKNKSINYNIYLKLLYISNFDTQSVVDEVYRTEMFEKVGKQKPKNFDTFEPSPELRYRFCYRNKLTYDKEVIEKFFDRALPTIDRNIKTLEVNNLIQKIWVNDSLVYRIFYSTNNREYVKLKASATSKLLKHSSIAIKIYVLLKYLCRNGEKQVTQKYIAEQIGLCSNSNKNLEKIRKEIYNLENDNLIRVRTVSDEKRKYNYYKVF